MYHRQGTNLKYLTTYGSQQDDHLGVAYQTRLCGSWYVKRDHLGAGWHRWDRLNTLIWKELPSAALPLVPPA